MRSKQVLLIVAILLVGIASPRVADAAPPGAASASSKQRVTPTHESARVRKELDRQVTWRFKEVPLADWVRILARDHRLPLVLDVKTCEAAGIGTDRPLSADLPPLPLRDAIRQTLKPLDLTIALDRGAWLITTTDEAENLPQTRVYPVADLVRYRFRGGYDSDFQPLIDAIQNTTGKPEPGWVDDGGVGTCEQFPTLDCLVISTTVDVHEQVEHLLEDLRAAKRRQGNRTPKYSAPFWYPRQGMW